MNDVINIGNRRELFCDDTIINKERTGTPFMLHHPVRRECVLIMDGPNGGDDCQYNTVINDNGLYKLYLNSHGTYEGAPADHEPAGITYYESRDGINWDRPKLGIATRRNAIYDNFLFEQEDETHPYYQSGEDGLLPMIDTNPDCLPEERIKAVVERHWPEKNRPGLKLYVSPDGKHFKSKGFLDINGQFDSHNTLLYDPYVKKYRVFFRKYHASHIPDDYSWRRDIRMVESDDLVHWSDEVMLRYDDYVDWELYTNGILRYHRADHIYMGFPTRFIDRKVWSDNFDELCGLEKRKTRAGKEATAVTDTLFMVSRDGINWKRYNDAFITPGPEHDGNWIYGSSFVSSGFVETPSDLPGEDNELSMYVPMGRFTNKPAKIYRYSLRLDGFVSAYAPWYGSQLVTKPFIYDGNELYINFSTSVYGNVRITLHALDGSGDISTTEMFGDSTNRHVRFKDGNTPAQLRGKPVEMTINLQDAHIYSFKFEEKLLP